MYLFKTLHLYIGRIYLKWFGFIALSLGSLLLLLESVELLRRTINKPHVTLATIVEMALLKLPLHLGQFLPFLTLCAVLMTFWRLNNTKEMVVIRTSGVSIWQIVQGLFLYGLVIGLFYSLMVQPMGSTMLQRYHQLESVYIKNKKPTEGTFFITESGLWMREVGENFSRILHFKNMELGTKTLNELRVYDFDEKMTLKTAYTAEKGVLDHQTLRLMDVTYSTLKPSFETKKLGAMDVATTLEEKSFLDVTINPDALTLWQLDSYIKILKESGLSYLKYSYAWHKLVAKIWLLGAMILLGASFALQRERTHQGFKFVLFGLLVSFLFHFSSDMIAAFSLSGRLLPAVAAWSPVVFISLISLTVLLYREEG